MNHLIISKAFRQMEKVLEQKRYESSLLDFAEYVWPVVEPAIPFIRGWALEAVAEHLEAVTDGYIRRLLINVPPGFTKSLMTDVFWPAWEWGPKNRPWLRYMCAAYSNHLTERDNMRCRNVVISDRYKRLWGERFKISNEQFTKIKFANDQTGWKLATSVSGIGTGERADRVIIDDPNNPKDMESEVVRDTVNMWFTEIIPDRLNNQAESSIVVIQQRTHEDDVSGTAIAREMGYTHLCIPMYYMPSHHINGYTLDDNRIVIKSFIGEEANDVPAEDVFWEDPREEDGDIAWPERFPLKICEELQRDKGPYAWSGQYQQNPEPRGGSIIKRDFWQLWKEDKYPPLEFILASLDTAYTAKEENDASALTIWGIFREDVNSTILGTEALWMKRDTPQIAKTTYGNPRIVLMHAWQERLEFNDLVQRVIDSCTTDSPRGGSQIGEPRFAVDKLIIESKASGQSIGQELHRLFRGTGKFGVELINPTHYGDKVARVHAIQHLFSDGMVYAPNKVWADMVINQCAIFPRGSHDDLVDSCFVSGTKIATARGAINIEEITTDDMVITPFGWRQVRASWMTGVRPVVSAYGLTGTPNHPVFTIDEGFKSLDSLTQANRISRLKLCDLIRIVRLRRSHSMESSLDAWEGKDGIICLNRSNEKGQKGCMLQFGSISQAEVFRRALKSTIETAIPLIAALRIWSVYRLACIVPCLSKIWTWISKSPIWKESDPWQPIGIGLRMGESGTGSMLLNPYRGRGINGPLCGHWVNSIVSGAAHRLKEKMYEISCVQADASQQNPIFCEENQRQFTLTMPVFNLEVEGARCYYANGILVHNCSQALRYLRDCGFALKRSEYAVELEEEMSYKSRSSPLYPC